MDNMAHLDFIQMQLMGIMSTLFHLQFVVSPKPILTIDDLLKNFDFTANAIGVNIKTGTIYDPVHGITDINNRVLRAVRLDFPERPVSNDIPLSAISVFWFRLLHFQNKLGFEFEKQTKEWAIKKYLQD